MLKGLSLVKRRANNHAAAGPQESKSEEDTAESEFLLPECPHVHVPCRRWKVIPVPLEIWYKLEADGL